VNLLNGHRETVNVLNEYKERLCECVKWIQGETV